jgi:hypothetical protein
LKKEMNSQQQLDGVKAEIAAIQQEINVAKEERKVAKDRLEKAVGESEIQRAKALLEAATAELTRLGQKEAKLMEEKIQLAHEWSSAREKAFTLMDEMFEKRFTFDGKSTSASKRRKFKPILARDYLQISGKQYSSKDDLTCQILGIELPKFLVTGSHLFKHEWAIEAWILLRISNIDSSRNGLLLFIPIEKAYDQSQLCFLKSDGEDSFYLKLLDPSIRQVALFDECKKFVNESECNDIGKSVSEVLSILETKLTVDGRMLTFEDIEGRKLICKGSTRPYKRCLNFHASRARSYALKEGWITDDVVFKFTWSQEFDLGAINSYLDQLGTSFESLEDAVIDNGVLDDIMPNDSIDHRDSDDESEAGSNVS